MPRACRPREGHGMHMHDDGGVLLCACGGRECAPSLTRARVSSRARWRLNRGASLGKGFRRSTSVRPHESAVAACATGPAACGQGERVRERRIHSGEAAPAHHPRAQRDFWSSFAATLQTCGRRRCGRRRRRSCHRHTRQGRPQTRRLTHTRPRTGTRPSLRRRRCGGRRLAAALVVPCM